VTGGNLFVCVDNSSNLYGVYSSFGYVRGSVNEDLVFTGSWFQAGLKTLDNTGDCCVDNYGAVSTVMVTPTKFAGSLQPNQESGIQALFQGDFQNNNTPADNICFLSLVPNGGTPLSEIQGKWTALGSTYLFDICIDDTGSTVGSYEYINTRTTGVIGATIRGYTVGNCYFGNSLCQMDWFEADQSWGGYVMSMHDNKTLFTEWWSGGSWQFDYNNVNDADYHGTETLKRILTTPDRCQRNKNLFFNAYPYPRAVVWAITVSTIVATAGLIVGLVFLVRGFRSGKIPCCKSCQCCVKGTAPHPK